MWPSDLLISARAYGFNTGSIVVAVLVVAVSVAVSLRWYRKRIREIVAKEVLRVTFVPTKDFADPSVYQLDENMQRWTDYLSIKSTCRQRYWSFGQYLRALKVENANKSLDPRAVSVSLVDALGFEVLLPIMMRSPYFTPNHKEEFKLSPEAQEIARLVFRDFISPLVLSAAASTLHKIGSGKRLSPVDSFSHFQRGYTDTYKFLFEGVDIPNPLRFPEDINGSFFQQVAERMVGRRREARADEAQARRAVSERFLPNLYFGTTDAYAAEASDREFALSLVLGMALNRLSASSVAKSEDLFFVEIEGTKCQRLDEFFHAVKSIQVTAQSRLTTFSNSLKVKVDEGWADVPLLIPMRTGINTVDGRHEIVVPFFHTGLTVSINDERIAPFADKPIEVDWYQDVGTFTGFMAPFSKIWPWHAPFQHAHWRNATKEQQVLALLACGELSAVNNELVSKLGLAAAGYGYTGVCNDSVAIVEGATFGLDKISVFPLLLAGQARTDIIQMIKERMLSSPPQQRYALERIQQAVTNMPCDIDTTPGEVKDTCRRICAMLPKEENCPFELPSIVRRQTQEHFQAT